jgi:hypothetical protein
MLFSRCAFASGLALLAACASGDIGGAQVDPSADASVSYDASGFDRDAQSGASQARHAAALKVVTSRNDAAMPDAAPPADAAPQDASPPVPPVPPVAKPPVTFDPVGGGFTNAFMLKLTAGATGAKLHYTLDGSLPSAASPEATAPLAISATTLVRAIAVRDGISSPVFNQSYFQLDADVQSFNSNLPIVIVHMLGGAAPQPSNRSYVGAMFGLFDTGNARAVLAGAAAHTSRLGVKIRGRSSRTSMKPSYTLELWGAADEDAPASLLGMPEDGDWVLYAPYDWDRSMMHNVFAYDLSRKLGRYAARTKYCEVFVVSGNAKVTMASYAGVYVLMERLTRSPSRVPVKKLEPGDTVDPIRSGGYIVKVDEPDAPNESFSAAGLTFVYVDPDADEIVPEQTQYLKDYLEACKRAAVATDGIDPTTGKHYSELIDVPSFIDHHILSMLMKNPDAFALSSYFYKDRDGKLSAGPLWDFDLAMGAEDMWGMRSIDPTHWGPAASDTMFRRSFWGPLFTHAEFATAYWQRWDELLSTTFTSAKFRETIDAFEVQVTEAEGRNRVRWPNGVPRNNSYPDEVEALETWLDARLTWITANKGTTPAP